MEPTPNGTLKQKPAVVLVHGTFANREGTDVALKPKEIEREGWWREGSGFCGKLKENLADIEPEIVPFKWSSENKERDRHEAGQALLDLLVEYENEGRDYHLIGHSHGGSVIWIALQQSLMRRWRSGKNNKALKLPHLKSWATVGTPFFHYRPSWLGEWYGKVITMLTLILSVMMMWWLGQREFEKWGNEGNPLLVLTEPFKEWGPAPDHPVEGTQAADQVEPVTKIKLEWANKPITAGDWITAFGQVFFAFIILVAPIFALYLWIRAQRTEACNVNREIRAQNQALLDFGDRWLGMWCTEDEAINGLRATVGIPDCEIIPRISIPGKRIFASDRLIRFYGFFIRIFFKPINNRLIAPQIDIFLLRRIAKGAQGNNRLGAKLIDVTEGPVLIDGHRYPSLPDPINRELIDKANKALSRRAGEILTNARSAFSQIAWAGAELKNVVENVKEELEGDELVHTSYFENEFVGEALATHVRQEQVREAEEILAEETEVSSQKPRRRWWQATLWFLLGAALAFFAFWEYLSITYDIPITTLSAALLALGIASIISAKKLRKTESKKSVAFATIAGGLMALIAVFYGFIVPFFGIDSKLATIFVDFLDSDSRFANSGLIIGALLTSAAFLFLISLHRELARPLYARTCLFLAQALLIAAAFASKESSTPFAMGLFIAFGLCKAFQPLRNQQDLFCPLERPQIPKEPVVPEASSPVSWILMAKRSLSQIRDQSEELKRYSLAGIDVKNRIAFLWFICFLVGIFWASAALNSSNQYWNYTSPVPACLSVFAFFLSFRAAFRSSRGARHTLVALANIHLTSFLALCLVVGLFWFFVYDGFLKTPRDSTPQNFTYVSEVGELSPEMFLVDSYRGEVQRITGNRKPTNRLQQYIEYLKKSPDDRTLAFVDGSSISLWDRTSESETTSFTGHSHSVAALAFIANRKVMASGSMDGILHFWDRRSGVSLDQFDLGHSIISMQAHPLRDRLAIGLSDGSVVLWDTFRRKKVAKERLHFRNHVKYIGFLGDNIHSLDTRGILKISKHDGAGNLVESLSLPDQFQKRISTHRPVFLHVDPEKAKIAMIWRSKVDKSISLQVSDPIGNEHWKAFSATIPAEFDSEIVADFGPGKNGITVKVRALWGNSPQYFIWEDVDDEKPIIGQFSGSSNSISNIDFSPDNSSLVTQTDWEIAVWDVASGDKKHARNGSGYFYGPEHDTLTIEDDSVLKILSLTNFEGVRKLPLDNRSIGNSKEGKLVATESGNGVTIWNAQSGKKIRDFEGGRSPISFSSDSRTCVIFDPSDSGNPRLKIYDISSGNELCAIPLDYTLYEGNDRLAFNHDSTRLLLTGRGHLNLWDANSGETLTIHEPNGRYLRLAAFSPNNEKLLGLWSDGTAELFDGSSGNRIGIVGERLDFVSFAPDGEAIATVSSDGVLKLQDVESGKEVRTFSESHRGVNQIRFSPDGEVIATMSREVVRLWDIKTGSLLHEISPITYFVTREEAVKAASTTELLNRAELNSQKKNDQSVAMLISDEIHVRFEQDRNEPALNKYWAKNMYSLASKHLEALRFQETIKAAETSINLLEDDSNIEDELYGILVTGYLFLNRMEDARTICREKMKNTDSITRHFDRCRGIEGLVTTEIEERFREIERLLDARQ